MASYEQDEDGVIHLVLEYGQADFTFCGRDFTGSDDERTQTFEGKRHEGPANCRDCLKDYTRLAASLKAARFARKLVQGLVDG